MQSQDPSMNFLLGATDLNGKPASSWLDKIILKELQKLASDLPEWHDSSCLFQNMGDFLARTQTLLSRLADRMVYGTDILEYANGQVKEMDDEHELSELGDLNDMDQKHDSLKAMTRAFTQTSDLVNSGWRSSKNLKSRQNRQLSESEMSTKSGSSLVHSMPPSPSPDLHHSTFQSSPAQQSPTQQSPINQLIHHPIEVPVLNAVHPHTLPLPRQPLTTLEPTVSTGPPSPLTPSPTVQASQMHHQAIKISSVLALPPFPRITSEPVQSADFQVHDLLKTITGRGTGQYRCPHGRYCNKGGVRGGKEIIFERNSAFRAHLQKHEKSFFCDMPGCTAKGGFARIDQLERHKRNVSHKT